MLIIIALDKKFKSKQERKVFKSRRYFQVIHSVYFSEYYVTVKIIFIKTVKLFGKVLI